MEEEGIDIKVELEEEEEEEVDVKCEPDINDTYYTDHDDNHYNDVDDMSYDNGESVDIEVDPCTIFPAHFETGSGGSVSISAVPKRPKRLRAKPVRELKPKPVSVTIEPENILPDEQDWRPVRRAKKVRANRKLGRTHFDGKSLKGDVDPIVVDVYQCDMCNFFATTAELLSSHMKKHQQKERKKRIMCQDCKTRFPSPEDLNNHIETYHVKGQGNCTYCNKELDLSNFKRHTRRCKTKYAPRIKKPVEAGSKCNFCPMVVAHQRNLEVHIKMFHSPDMKFLCNICLKSFMTEELLNKHQSKTHRPKTLPCNYCEKTFSRTQLLNLHMGSNHPEQLQFNCTECKAKLPNEIALQKHFDRHHACKEWQCSSCPKTFKTHKILQTHVLRRHPVEKKLPCPECDATFLTPLSLTYHRNKAHTEKPAELVRNWKCEFCPKAYVERRRLKDHLEEKHPEADVFQAIGHYKSRRRQQNFQCGICLKWFTVKKYHKLHMREHHPEDFFYAMDDNNSQEKSTDEHETSQMEMPLDPAEV